jgi:PAS domain S-box-containing protein
MDNLFQALAGSADGAFVIDEDQLIVYWNPSAQEMLGYRPEEVIGRLCYDVLTGRGDRGQPICRHHCYVAAIAVTGSPVTTYDTCARTKSGEQRWINVSILTLSPPNGASPLVVHLFRDATEKKQSEQFTREVLRAAKLLSETAALPLQSAEAVEAPGVDLTEREREVLALLAQGLSTRDIAESLSISSATVRNHTQNILHKLQVHSRLEAVAYAFEHGLV